MNTDSNNILIPAPRIIAIDDSPINRMYIEKSFTPPEFDLTLASDAKEGLKKIKDIKPELILLDIMMPEVDGFTLCRHLKENESTKEIPIIFITALDDLESRIRAFEVGGADYVTKPFNHRELKARVLTHIKLKRESEQKIKIISRLKEQQKNESIVRIAAGISHNFNNMLGVAQGNLSFLKNVIKEDNEYIRGALNDIEISLSRLSELVKKFMMLLNKEEAVNRERCSLKELIDAISENIKNQYAGVVPVTKIRIVNKISENSFIFCNYKDMWQVFSLLLSEPLETNAFKTEILLTEEVSDVPQYVKIRIEIKNIKLPDEPNIENRIFEPFGLPLANVGSGMGFPVAKETIEKNKGKIYTELKKEHNNIVSLNLLVSLPSTEEVFKPSGSNENPEIKKNSV